MKGDYLWDGSGEPDPEVQRLEELLGRFRHTGRVPLELDHRDPPLAHQGQPPAVLRFRRSYRTAVVISAAALLMVAVGAGIYSRVQTSRRHGYEIVSVTGAPRVGAHELARDQRASLRTGEWIETDSGSSARIRVGLIGQLELGPNTRLRLVSAQETAHRLELESGLMHARIWAPPRVFQVGTRSALAVDLGCAYTLEVDRDGAGLLRVASGWVAFERDGRESFVPAGAMCLTRPRVGPGTPFRSDVSERYRQALERIDFASVSPAERQRAIEIVIAEARVEDSLTLWHLLNRCADPAERDAVYDGLARLVAPPPGVTRDGIAAGDRRMKDLWWDQLGLGDTNWWRRWKGPVPGSQQ